MLTSDVILEILRHDRLNVEAPLVHVSILRRLLEVQTSVFGASRATLQALTQHLRARTMNCDAIFAPRRQVGSAAAGYYYRALETGEDVIVFEQQGSARTLNIPCLPSYFFSRHEREPGCVLRCFPDQLRFYSEVSDMIPASSKIWAMRRGAQETPFPDYAGDDFFREPVPTCCTIFESELRFLPAHFTYHPVAYCRTRLAALDASLDEFVTRLNSSASSSTLSPKGTGNESRRASLLLHSGSVKKRPRHHHHHHHHENSQNSYNILQSSSSPRSFSTSTRTSTGTTTSGPSI